jgi:hypothetical protein
MDDAWRHERFVVTIQQRTGIGWDKAERAVQATLETLAARSRAGRVQDDPRDRARDGVVAPAQPAAARLA